MGKVKEDENFGTVEVYYDRLDIELPITATAPTTINVSYQGCADAGLCYPPQTFQIQFEPPAAKAAITTEPPVASATSTPNTRQDNDLSSAGGIVSLLEKGSLWLIILSFFALGLGLTFTPCVLPMIPILSGIITAQQKITTQHAFSLSLAYVMGMALTYAAAGVIAASIGAEGNIQMYMQHPVILGFFAILFIVLSLSMFGYYELQLPHGLQQRLNKLSQKQSGGTYLGVSLMGAISALVVSPCVTAPLIGALIYISATGDQLLGGSALLALGLGMGTPLLIIGTSGGKFLPKAGPWMVAIKSFFGVMMLAIAIWLLERLLPGPITLVLWAALLLISAIHMGALEHAESGMKKTWKGLAILMILYAAMLLMGAATGQSDPLKPLKAFTSSAFSSDITSAAGTPSHMDFDIITTPEQLDQLLTKARLQQQPVMLDFYADWCISCKIMARETFDNPNVLKRMQGYRFIQADVTDNSPENQALLSHYQLFGPPGILFFDSAGKEIAAARIMGEMDRADFLTHLDQHRL